MSPVTSTLMVILTVNLFSLSTGSQCVPRKFQYDSVVCVCNSTYCDSAPRNVPEKGSYAYYESNRGGARLHQKNVVFQNSTADIHEPYGMIITINSSQTYQTMRGLGGAFTDATGINFMRMSNGSRNNIMEAYFGVNGNRYTLGRVPIAGTDFSTRPYTYDDYPGDNDLSKFALTSYDYQYKIPMMKWARTMTPNLRFVSAAWSAPEWMKTNHNITGFGYLAKAYYQIYAEYLTKFLVEYKNQGLNIWAISTGNEPAFIETPAANFNDMGWSSQNAAIFVAENLAPTIARSSSNDTIIVIVDDMRFNLPWVAVDIFENAAAYNATAGIAVHWYFDQWILPQVLDMTHDYFPNRFILMTEGCVGTKPMYSVPVELGDWGRAEDYVQDLMQNFNHWVTGFIDWNMVLDRQGGPNWAQNFVDSPIIIDPETDEFFKQPTYYALAHFSKFIPPGSVRIGTENVRFEDNVAFLTPDNEIVLILMNRADTQHNALVEDPENGYMLIEMSAKSIGTIIYKR